MKIVCSVCKSVIGEQKPFNDSSEVHATCTTCIEKARVENAKRIAEPALRDGKEISLGGGLKGTLWVVKDKKDNLSIGDMVVSGKRFFCTKDERANFQNYLTSLTGEEVDVTFFSSLSFKLGTTPRGRKKKQEPPKVEEPKNNETIYYNCTARMSKHYAQLMFNDLAERMDTATRLLVDAMIKNYNEDRQKKPDSTVKEKNTEIPKV